MSFQQAILDIQQGKPVLVADDYDRENEADLIIAAETLTIPVMAQMIRDGSGIVCLCLTEADADADADADNLELFPMEKYNTSQFKTAFTITIEAKMV